MYCFSNFCHCQQERSCVTEKYLKRGSKKRHQDALRGHIYRKNVSLLLHCGIVNGWDWTKLPVMLNYISKKVSSTDLHLQNTKSYKKRKKKTLKAILKYLKKWKPILLIFLQCSKMLVNKIDIGDQMKDCAEEKRSLSQLLYVLILSFTFQNGTLIIVLFFYFYLELGFLCTKILHLVKYNPKSVSTALYMMQ